MFTPRKGLSSLVVENVSFSVKGEFLHKAHSARGKARPWMALLCCCLNGRQSSLVTRLPTSFSDCSPLFSVFMLL